MSFAYPGVGSPVLDRLSLEVGPGEVLAIVGVNGAGKSTLIRLLAGMHEPDRGRITIAGRALPDIDIKDWRRQVTVVLQDFVRYPATVRDNITLSAPELPASDQAVADVLDISGMRPQVDSLPGRLDTVLWEGAADLSGGQWQRTAIARALYAVRRGRSVIVLDEPTAQLDVEAEAEFYDRVVRAVRGTTVILISHRLSTVRNADRIAVLSAGRITESGTHPELMRRNGDYAELFRLQASRFDAGMEDRRGAAR
ncbi:hypothetical protein BJF79_09605 [Actinomadura sp. CNU-125]|uniref:ATP-binding cassette domain-containing protein n=1 Tax=Actinomadura sp. CNU-125 TaxID=1904961 RepID=UPI00096907C4|nr:ATP-binding cassette domain-containing protein [Actinomadura sp. CNU-125]OLT30492.1 hypothetical protein BJF79_09605 [Actinomadura sp. CNU-125]